MNAEALKQVLEAHAAAAIVRRLACFTDEELAGEVARRGLTTPDADEVLVRVRELAEDYAWKATVLGDPAAGTFREVANQLTSALGGQP